MAEEKSGLDELIGSLERLRDQLKLKLHLASKDAQDEWQNLEQKWEGLKRQARPVTDVVDETARNVGSAAEMAAEELKRGYKKLSKILGS